MTPTKTAYERSTAMTPRSIDYQQLVDLGREAVAEHEAAIEHYNEAFRNFDREGMKERAKEIRRAQMTILAYSRVAYRLFDKYAFETDVGYVCFGASKREEVAP